MELHNMKPTPGSRHTKKRVGRGDKTAGRGENGQKSRAGYSKKFGFEGGQNPLYRRLPKRGFKNINTKEYTIINLDSLSKLNTTDITIDFFVKEKIIKSSKELIKILGNGELTSKFGKVQAHKFSASAQEALKKSGAKVEIIEKKNT